MINLFWRNYNHTHNFLYQNYIHIQHSQSHTILTKDNSQSYTDTYITQSQKQVLSVIKIHLLTPTFTLIKLLIEIKIVLNIAFHKAYLVYRSYMQPCLGTTKSYCTIVIMLLAQSYYTTWTPDTVQLVPTWSYYLIILKKY